MRHELKVFNSFEPPYSTEGSSTDKRQGQKSGTGLGHTAVLAIFRGEETSTREAEVSGQDCVGGYCPRLRLRRRLLPSREGQSTGGSLEQWEGRRNAISSPEINRDTWTSSQQSG